MSEAQVLREVAVAELRRRIIRGDYAAGDRLVEAKLAASMGVSRNPIREAIRVLASEGFIEIMPRRGAVVASLSQHAVRDLFEVRIALEAMATGLAADRATDADIAHLRGILDDAARGIADGDVARLADLNAAFHERIVAMSGNAYLGQVLVAVREQIKWVFSRTAGGERGRESWAEHRLIVDTINARNAGAAYALAASHVRAAADTYWKANGSGQAAVNLPAGVLLM